MLVNDNMLQGEENLGMAMTFTLVSHLREQLSILVKAKLDRRLFEEKEKERLALEVGINEMRYPFYLVINLRHLGRRDANEGHSGHG